MSERPTEFSQEIADRLCDRISSGDTIRDIVQDIDMPNKRTIRKWRAENSEFFSQYIAAFQDHGQLLIDQIKRHMDSLENGEIDPQVAKILIDTKMKLAGRLYPEIYGDKSKEAPISYDIDNKVLTSHDLQIFKEMGFKI